MINYDLKAHYVTMPFTLFSCILPAEIANIIFNFVKLQKTVETIYWEKLYSPASLILENLTDAYSDYEKVFKFTPYFYDINRVDIIIRATNIVASQGLLQKNIYIYMDKYIDNLYALKKHVEFHFKNTRHLCIFNEAMNECLNKIRY